MIFDIIPSLPDPIITLFIALNRIYLKVLSLSSKPEESGYLLQLSIYELVLFVSI